MTQSKRWLIIAIIVALLAAPHAMIIRVAVDSADPYYWNILRFAPLAIVLLPMVCKYWQRIVAPGVWPRVFGAGVSMALAVILYTLAIAYSQASYVSIITLTIPIITIVLSIYFLKEKLTHQAVAGISLAALGAVVLVVLPIALAQGAITFYPLATVFALLNSFFISLAIILMREVNEQNNMPLTPVIGVNAIIITLMSVVLFWLLGDYSMTPTNAYMWLAALYSGFGIAFVFRMLLVKVFEHVGAAMNGAIGYFETFIAILLPVFFIGEKLSITMVVGGVCILLGIYVIEHHRRPHAKQHAVWRHH